MTSPAPRASRERLAGLLLLGIAVVLLVSSVTWFGSDRAGVGIGQVVLGVVLAALGALLLRRSGPRRPSARAPAARRAQGTPSRPPAGRARAPGGQTRA